jgi:hypothetical protein
MYNTVMLSKELVAASTVPLVLSVLTEGENYGYELIRRVRELSGGEIEWTEGMLYPVLHWMEREKLIDSEWRTAAGERKRKYYRLRKDRPRSPDKTMENQTSFDLSRAIQQWRENLAQSPAFRTADLNELESHLRDSMATLQSSGLSPAEALLIASRRIGPSVALAAEFQKARHIDVVWNRVVWVCIGLQIWLLISSGAPIILNVYAWAAFAASLAISKTFRGVVRNAMAWCLAQPVFASATLMLLSLGQRALTLALSNIYFQSEFTAGFPAVCRNSTALFWCTAYQRGYLNILPELGICIVLITVVALSRWKDRETPVSATL